jgi:hypothetical protein
MSVRLYVCNNTVVDELLLMKFDIVIRNMYPLVLNFIQFGQYGTFPCVREIGSPAFQIYFSKYLQG